MRKTKRELLAADSTGDKDKFTEKSVLLRRQKEEYGKFSKAAGLLTQNERTQVYGYDRSKSAKTVWAERKAAGNGLTSGGGSSIMNLTLNDFIRVSENTTINQDSVKAVYEALSNIEKRLNDTFFESVEIKNIPPDESKRVVVFQTIPIANGRAPLKNKLVINSSLFSNDIDNINKRISSSHDTNHIIAQNIEEALVHEVGHAKFNRKYSAFEISDAIDRLNEYHITSVSTYASKNGLECLSEVEVLLYKGIKVPQDALELYNKYMR